jgi:signal transduction histidine kinase
MESLLKREQALVLVFAEPEVALLLAPYLENYDSQVVQDAEQALIFAQQRRPNLVLLDERFIRQSYIDQGGVDFCRSLKALPECEHTPILVIFDCVPTDENLVVGYQMGMSDYISQPFQAALVNIKLSIHLAGYEKLALLAKSHEQLLDFNVALLSQQEIMVAVADLTTELTFYLSKTGELKYLSPCCEALLGLSHTFLLNHPQALREAVTESDRPLWDDLFSAVDESSILSIPKHQRTQSHEIYMHKYQGERLRVRVSTCPVLNGPGHLLGFRAAIVDITDTHQMHLELREARINAEAADQAKARFLAMMSHELRTPLNGVLGILDLMAVDQQRTEDQSMLKTARASAIKLLQLIESVLDFVHGEGEHHKQLQRFSINQLLKQVVVKASIEAKQASVNLSQVPLATAAFVEGYPQQLETVLMHLLSNAIKFTPEGGSVTLSVEQEVNDWRFIIQDTGQGIPKEQLERIFEPFVQLDDSFSRLQDGSGFGLAICKRILDRLGGRIDVESQLGQGSRFEVSLPLLTVRCPSIHCLDWGNEGFSGPLAYSLQKQLEYLGYRIECSISGNSLEPLNQFPNEAYVLIYVRHLTADVAQRLLDYQLARRLHHCWIAVEQADPGLIDALSNLHLGVLVLPVEMVLLKQCFGVQPQPVVNSADGPPLMTSNSMSRAQG